MTGNTRTRNAFIFFTGIVCILLIGYVFFTTNPPPIVDPLPDKAFILRVTHTESNGEAKRLLNEIAEDLEREYQGKGIPLDIRIEYVSWGGLSGILDAGLQTENAPHLTHLQPFMAYELHLANLLEPIDDVIDDIESENGKILSSVRDLQNFDGRHYGLAYAVGTTFFSYRKDWAIQAGLEESESPKNWKELILFIKKLDSVARSKGGRGVVILPGRDPFFMEQFFVEVCGSAGVDLWERSTFRPRLDSPEVKDVLNLLRKLRPYLHEEWLSANYLDQFDLLRDGQVGFAPVTYGRAALVLENSTVVETPNDSVFGVLEQPGVTSNERGIATIDCEAWAILRSGDDKHIAAAKEFLRLYYSPKYYVRFCSSAPIHLTPIFTTVSESQAYLENVVVKEWRSRWSSWYAQSDRMLRKNRTSPILMANSGDREAPFLMDFQKRAILAELVTRAISNPDTPLDELQAIAQQRAELAWRENVRK